MAGHPWWYRAKGVAEAEMNRDALKMFQQADGRESRAAVFKSISTSRSGEVESGRVRLALHYWKKNNAPRALEMLDRILAEEPGNKQAQELRQKIAGSRQ